MKDFNEAAERERFAEWAELPKGSYIDAKGSWLAAKRQAHEEATAIRAFAQKLWEVWVAHCDGGLLADAETYENLNAHALAAGFTITGARASVDGEPAKEHTDGHE